MIFHSFRHDKHILSQNVGYCNNFFIIVGMKGGFLCSFSFFSERKRTKRTPLCFFLCYFPVFSYRKVTKGKRLLTFLTISGKKSYKRNAA